MDIELINVSGRTFRVTNGVAVCGKEIDRVTDAITDGDSYYAGLEDRYKTAYTLGVTKGMLYDALMELISLKRQIRRLEDKLEQQEQEMAELAKGE